MAPQDKDIWNTLSKEAWKTLNNAYILSSTKVGASIESDLQMIFCGCNIQQTFRSHDIHAEVNAIGNMVSNGGKKIKKILVVANKDFFTPCGSCMDWIMQFSDENTIVGFQGSEKGEIKKFKVSELMPHYPKK